MKKTFLPIVLACGAAIAATANAASYCPDNYFPIEITNNSGISSDHAYMLIKAEVQAGKDKGNNCFLDFSNGKLGVCKQVSLADPSWDSAAASKSLLQLPKNANGNTEICVPHVASGRVYFSYKYPMDLPVVKDAEGKAKIVDADGFQPRDSNYYTLYDKAEFSFVIGHDAETGKVWGGTWMNPTAVDFFSVPIRIEQKGSTSKIHTPTGEKDLTATGFTEGRANIFTTLHQAIDKIADKDKSAGTEWNKLFLNYDNGQDKLTLRFISPGKAMIKGIPGTNPFDDQYFIDGKKYGTTSGESYQSSVWKYYKQKGHELKIDVAELRREVTSGGQKVMVGPKEYIGQVVTSGGEDVFKFSSVSGKYAPVIFKEPTTSNSYFSGVIGAAARTSDTPGAIIERELTSAMVVGLLPVKDGATLNKKYFEDNFKNYYKLTNGVSGEASTPWYDLYAKALHNVDTNRAGNQPIYTFAYDDALLQDGTLHDDNAINPSAAHITLEPMNISYKQLPHVFDSGSDKSYPVIPIIPATKVGPMIKVQTCAGQPWTTGKQETVHSPVCLKVTYHDDPKDLSSPTKTKEFNLYIDTLRETSGGQTIDKSILIVRPMVDGTNGVQIQKGNDGNEPIFLEFPAKL